MWQLLRDRKELKSQLREARESSKPDQALISGMMSELKKVNDHIRERGGDGKVSEPFPHVDYLARKKAEDTGTTVKRSKGQNL